MSELYTSAVKKYFGEMLSGKFANVTENVKNNSEKLSKMQIKLNNGKQIPVIGLGTWRSATDVVVQAVKDAIDVGYRHIDCAHSYGNEREVGLAIKEKIDEGVIKREDLYITSKLWCTNHHPNMVRRACENSLRNLGLKYLDNYLIHWPTAFKESDDIYPKNENDKVCFADISYVETWHAMEELVDAGLCSSIGISNFNKRQIEDVLKIARIPPTVLQIECHPYLNQKCLIEFARAKNIVVVCYSPLGSAHTPYEKPGKYKVLENPVILQIANNYKRSAAQILIRYQIDRGNVVIFRSVNKKHMLDNLNAVDFELSASDQSKIDELDINGRYMTFKVAAEHPNYPFQNDVF